MKLSRQGHRLAVAAAVAACAAAQAGPTGILYAGPSLDVVELSPGVFGPVGYVNPSMSYTLPSASSGGTASGSGMGVGAAQYSTGTAFLGQRGIVITSSGSYALGTLGANSVDGWTPAGFASSSAQATNDSGLIVGSSTLYAADGTREFGGRAVYYTPGSATPVQLQGPAGFTDSSGWGITAATNVSSTGVVIGFTSQYQGDMSLGNRALRWTSAAAAPQLLDNLRGHGADGSNTSAAVAVNAAGTAVGWGNSFTRSGRLLGQSAVRWDAGGTAATALGHLGTSSRREFSSHATAINDAGMVIGHSSKYDSTHVYQGEVAVRWDANSTKPVDLGALGRDAEGLSFSYALAVNNAGSIAGVSQKFDDSGAALGTRAVRWGAADTAPTELALLSEGADGASFSYAFDINAAGYIVGSANIVGTSSAGFGDPTQLELHAALWTPDGAVIDLNTLLPENSGWSLYGAYSISDSGWITGIGWYQPEGLSSDYAYARLFGLQLAPVPEPASALLLACGIAAVSLRRRRQNNVFQ